MQTKKQSIIESLINLLVGYGLSLISLFIILPLLGIQSSSGKNILITLYFTVLSFFRSYLLRRFFNGKGKPKYSITEELDYRLYCFDCEYETPVKEIPNNICCMRCGLKHFTP